jgi:hypothetical protein
MTLCRTSIGTLHICYIQDCVANFLVKWQTIISFARKRFEDILECSLLFFPCNASCHCLFYGMHCVFVLLIAKLNLSRMLFILFIRVLTRVILMSDFVYLLFNEYEYGMIAWPLLVYPIFNPCCLQIYFSPEAKFILQQRLIWNQGTLNDHSRTINLIKMISL